MFKLFRWMFLALLLTALVWGAVVWRWQQTHRVIESRDIVLYLVVLPLVVVGGVLALRWAWRRADAAQAAAATAAASSANAKPAAPAAEPAERVLVMRLLASNAVLPGAETAAAALEMSAEPPPVALDETLCDRDGMGVFTRRCASVDSEAFALALADELPEADGAFDDAMVRALALVDPCVEPVLQVLRETSDALAAAHAQAASNQHPMQARARQPMARPPLRVVWALDERLPERQRQRLTQWAELRVRQWAARAGSFEWLLEAVPVGNGERLLAHAERRLLLAHREKHDEPMLLIAAQSSLGEELVEALDTAGRLFTAQRPSGVMPGEAAAALLLVPPALEGAPATTIPWPVEAPLQLHRLSLQRREKSADESGRIAGKEMAEAIRQAIEAAQRPADKITLAVTDTDLQRSRTSELFEALQAAAPHLGVVEQCRCIGSMGGAMGIASAPAVLALAAAHVQQHQEPALALSNADPFDRLAALLWPPPTSADKTAG